MAANTNKRIPVKWVRDRAKSAYDKKDHCYICLATTELELHHTHSVTLLLNAWADRKSYDISTDEGILAVRDEFIEEYRTEIYDDVFTLCSKHHIHLHSIYGKAPPITSAPRQSKWIELQKAKLDTNGVGIPTPKVLSNFSNFY